MSDYSFYYKDKVNIGDLASEQWDIFISAFDRSERVRSIFSNISAKRKVCIIHTEYEIDPSEIPPGAFVSTEKDEDEFILQAIETTLGDLDLTASEICIDITGFLRPHLLFLVRLLTARGVARFTAVYAEPSQYSLLDDTSFGSDQVHSVRPVKGYEGVSSVADKRDLLVISAGFEDRLVSEVAEDKELARKYLLLGLPSLKADMYQQSVLRTNRAKDSLGDGVSVVFAPASDPFATATLLSELVEREHRTTGFGSLYLAPIATKPATLGFALFYLKECEGTPSSILFPFSNSYSTEASNGVGRIWRYVVEL